METSAKVVDVRIDAFTATSSIIGNRASAKAFISGLAYAVNDMYFAFAETKRLKKYGADGWAKGSMTYLVARKKGSLDILWNSVSVTGEHSQQVMELAMSYDEEFKCTRVDFAVDVQFSTPKPQYLSVMYEKNAKWDTSLRLIRGATGDTLYKNSRQSAKMGRVYDKSSAYNLERGLVYRFELESKKIDAQKLKLALSETSDIKNLILSYTTQVFKNWAIPMPTQGGVVITPQIKMIVSTDLQKLEWLTSISGAIKGLVERGYESQVRDILNLPEYIQGDLTSVWE